MFNIKKLAMYSVALAGCMSMVSLPVKHVAAAELACPPEVQIPSGKGISVSSASALKTAVAKAKGGEFFLLRPGNYGDLSYLSGRKFSTPITITSADRWNKAIVTSTRIASSENIRLSHLKFYADGTGKVPSWGNTPLIYDDYEGLPRQPGKTGLRVDNSRNITVADSIFSGHNRAFLMTTSSNLTIVGNVFTNTTMDHMAFSGVSNVLIEGNHTGGFKTFWSSHNDAIQFWNAGKNGRPSTNITIRNNVITATEQPGSKAGVQGIFVFNERVQREGGTIKDFHKDILIEDNVVVTSHPNAITLLQTTGAKVLNNTALVDCANIKKGWEPRITVHQRSTGVTLAGNKGNKIHATSTSVVKEASFPSSWRVTGNTVTKACMSAPDKNPMRCKKDRYPVTTSR